MASYSHILLICYDRLLLRFFHIMNTIANITILKYFYDIKTITGLKIKHVMSGRSHEGMI